MSDERRTFQRLSLSHALDGWFGDFPVRLVDVSATGAMIEYDEEIPLDSRALLRFYWQDEELEILSEIVRHSDGRSGLHFIEQNRLLNDLIAHSAAEVLRAQAANAAGDREANRFGDSTLTAASAGLAGHPLPFLVCKLGPAGWSRKPALLAEQPEHGFTVSSKEPPQEVEMLCHTYEQGDAEARRITRLLAELSVARAR